MADFLKKMIEMWREKRWLKEIDKAVDRYKKAQSKANRENFVMKKLWCNFEVGQTSFFDGGSHEQE